MQYLLSFLTNVAGSVVYYITLASADVSLAAPVSNALTFIITTEAGQLLGENVGGKSKQEDLSACITFITTLHNLSYLLCHIHLKESTSVVLFNTLQTNMFLENVII